MLFRSDYIDTREDREPVLVVGDFNSYTTEDRDWSDIFGPDLKQVPITEPLTFNDGHYTGKFDRAWISTSLAGGVTEHVLGPCNSSSSAAVSAYNHAISDHCPVKLTVQLGNR